RHSPARRTVANHSPFMISFRGLPAIVEAAFSVVQTLNVRKASYCRGGWAIRRGSPPHATGPRGGAGTCPSPSLGSANRGGQGDRWGACPGERAGNPDQRLAR